MHKRETLLEKIHRVAAKVCKTKPPLPPINRPPPPTPEEQTRRAHLVSNLSTAFYNQAKYLHRWTRLLNEIKQLQKLAKTRKFTPEENTDLDIMTRECRQAKADFWSSRKYCSGVELYNAEAWMARVLNLHQQTGEQWKGWKRVETEERVEEELLGVAWKNGIHCNNSGGCCGRACGCCFRPRVTLQCNTQIYTHCTAECACCVEYFKSLDV